MSPTPSSKRTSTRGNFMSVSLPVWRRLSSRVTSLENAIRCNANARCVGTGIDSKRPRAVAQVHVVRRISPVGIVGTVFDVNTTAKIGNGGGKSSGRTNVGILRCREDGRGEQTSEEGRGGDDDGVAARRGDVRVEKEDRRTNMIRKHRRIEQTGTRRGLKCNLYRACVDVEMYGAISIILGDGKSHTRVRYPNVTSIFCGRRSTQNVKENVIMRAHAFHAVVKNLPPSLRRQQRRTRQSSHKHRRGESHESKNAFVAARFGEIERAVPVIRRALPINPNPQNDREHG